MFNFLFLVIIFGLEIFVWMDYRLVVLFIIVIFLFLLIWVFVKNFEVI